MHGVRVVQTPRACSDATTNPEWEGEEGARDGLRFTLAVESRQLSGVKRAVRLSELGDQGLAFLRFRRRSSRDSLGTFIQNCMIGCRFECAFRLSTMRNVSIEQIPSLCSNGHVIHRKVTSSICRHQSRFTELQLISRFLGHN